MKTVINCDLQLTDSNGQIDLTTTPQQILQVRFSGWSVLFSFRRTFRRAVPDSRSDELFAFLQENGYTTEVYLKNRRLLTLKPSPGSTWISKLLF